MWWKVLLAILAIWLLFGVIMAVLKSVLWLAFVALIVIGGFTVVRWALGGKRSKSSIGS